MSLSVSSGLLRIFNELKGTTDSSRQKVKRNEVFIRLKQKFSILLPPPKLDVRKTIVYINYIPILLKICI